MKKCSGFFVFLFFFGCQNSTPGPVRPPIPNSIKPKVQAEVIYVGYMDVEDSRLYERVLLTGGFCQRKLAFGTADCANWTGDPAVELVLNQDLKSVKRLSLTAIGSGSGFVGNRNARGGLILFQEAPINKINDDEGWQANLNNGQVVLILKCKYCDLDKDGDFNDIDVFLNSASGDKLGTLSLNPSRQSN